MATTILEVKGLHKTYLNGEQETPVLRGVDLRVEEGDFLALMGPSGSGKSTLMHILGFLDRPTGGQYLFQSQDVSQATDDELAKLRQAQVGFVFQAFHLLPRLSVLENVMLPMVYGDVPADERRIRATKSLESVGLAERLNYLPSQLSGGQKQRVAIARALVMNPKVIFADEPTGNLDSQSSENVLQILKDLNEQGRTIIMVTHEPDVAAVTKKIIRLKDGLIV